MKFAREVDCGKGVARRERYNLVAPVQKIRIVCHVQGTRTLLNRRQKRGVELVSSGTGRNLDLLPDRGASFLQLADLQFVIDKGRVHQDADHSRIWEQAAQKIESLRY